MASATASSNLILLTTENIETMVFKVRLCPSNNVLSSYILRTIIRLIKEAIMIRMAAISQFQNLLSLGLSSERLRYFAADDKVNFKCKE